MRIGALGLGWLLVAGLLAGIWGHLNIYSRGQIDPGGLAGSMIDRFDIANSLISFFSSFGNALLAFLIAAVLRMIEKQAPVGNAYVQRVMIASCLAYAAESAARLCSFFVRLPEALQVFSGYGGRFWLPYFSTAIPAVIPLFYAVTIFALYTHFTKMVAFESEVA